MGQSVGDHEFEVVLPDPDVPELPSPFTPDNPPIEPTRIYQEIAELSIHIDTKPTREKSQFVILPVLCFVVDRYGLQTYQYYRVLHI